LGEQRRVLKRAREAATLALERSSRVAVELRVSEAGSDADQQQHDQDFDEREAATPLRAAQRFSSAC
jgi:hypothetical protein